MSSDNKGSKKIISAFPNLNRDERINLVQQLERNAKPNIDFAFMMLFSASLASLGLLADSTAVVIGAMLVAPLMGPLVAAGLALVQANLHLFRRSLASTAIGLGIGFVAALILGTLGSGYEPTLEMEARGKADFLDLGIAFISGMTAAYASGRSNVVTTLAGVAIAAALVPPLAVVGIALTHGSPLISLNAAILLITNLVAIIIGAAVVFRLFQVHVALHGSDIPVWARRSTMLLFLALVFLSAPLLFHMNKGKRIGQNRPLEYQLAPHVREAVKQYIEEWPAVELVTQGRNSVEPEAGVTVLLMSSKKLSPGFEKGLIDTINKARGDEPVVQIFPMLSARRKAPNIQPGQK